MDNNMKNLDELFKDGLGDYTETPPPTAWGALEKKLDAAPPKGGLITYRKLMLLMLAGVLLLSIPMFKMLPGQLDNGNEATETVAAASDNNIPTTPYKAESTVAGDLPENTRDANAANNNDEQNATGNKYTDIHKEQHNSGETPHEAERTGKPHGHAIAMNRTGFTNGEPTNEPAKTNLRRTALQAKTNEEDEKGEASQNYHSDLSKPAPVEATKDNEAEVNEPEAPPAKPATEIVNTATGNKEDKNTAAKKIKAPKPKYNKWEAGVKAGYERGFDNDAAKKIVISPYLQYNVSPKFSLMMQPAVKGAEIANRSIGSPESYYRINNDATVTRDIDSNVIIPFDPRKYYMVKDTFRQTHDSIVKGYAIGGTYLEFEVPVVLKYALSKKFSVYGGVNISYSRLVNVREETSTHYGIMNTMPDKPFILPYGTTLPPPKVDGSDIAYSGTPIAGYTGPKYTGSNEGKWRAGYMAGFSYQAGNRVLIDAIVQQTSVKPNVQGGYNINKALSAPYIRFTIGYKLTK